MFTCVEWVFFSQVILHKPLSNKWIMMSYGVLCIGEFLDLLHPSILVAQSNIRDIFELKELKCNHFCSGRCQCAGNSHYMCNPCRAIKRKMCRGYHGLANPLEELVGRLVYEYMFDFISARDLVLGTWERHNLRDHGHHLRIIKLQAIVKELGMYCSWIIF